jgi:hypothetical protein
MYQLVKAIGKNLDGSRWASVEIGDVPMKTLYSTYKYLWATLSNPFIDHQVALDLMLLIGTNRFNTQTFNEYLASLGNLALPTQDTIPEINPQYVRYADVWKAGYSVQPIHDTAAPDSPLPVSEKHHLHLTKTGLTYSDFYDYCLVSINGMYHYSDGNNSGVYVKDGMRSINKAGRNMIGMTSFKNVGKIRLIPITDDMIFKLTDDQQYCHQMYLDLKEDFTGKQVFICIGGYLHINDKNFMRQWNDTCWYLNFDRYPIVDRYFQSKDLIDLSSLDLFVPPRSESAVEMDELLSDAAMLAMMKLSQTFVVVLDTPEFFYEKQFIRGTKIPGHFVSAVNPIYPMITDLGKLANYWPHPDDGLFSLTTQNTLRHNRAYRTTKMKDLPVVSDQRRANDPVNQSRAFFQVMGKDM